MNTNCSIVRAKTAVRKPKQAQYYLEIVIITVEQYLVIPSNKKNNNNNT